MKNESDRTPIPTSTREQTVARDHHQYRRQSGYRRWRILLNRLWWPSIIVYGLLRLAIGSIDEIIPLSQDSANYAYQAIHYLTDDPAGKLPSQRPGISMVAQTTAFFGVPYKLFIDFLFIVTACLTANFVRHWSHSNVLGMLVYVTLLLNPWFINHSRIYMSEPFYAILMVLLLLATLPWLGISVARWTFRQFLPAISICILMALTRPESLVILGYWLVLMTAVFLHKRRRWKRYSVPRRLFFFATIVAPVCVMLLITSAWKKLHQDRFGVPAMCVSESPGLTSLMSALYSISPAEKIRYAPVTRDTLELACDYSPVLHEHRQRLLNPQGANFGFAKNMFGLENQVASMLNWHLLSSFGGMDLETNRQMTEAARQIRDAQQAGQLGYRSARFPIDPLWNLWLPDIPQQTIKSLRCSWWPDKDQWTTDETFRPRVTDALDQGNFDDALLLRNGTRGNQTIRVRAVLPAGNSRFTAIELLNPDLELLDRENIPSPQQSRFVISMTAEQVILPPNTDQVFVRLVAVDSVESTEPLPIELHGWTRLPVRDPQAMSDPSRTERWSILVDRIPRQRDWRLSWQKQIRKWYSVVVGVLLGMSFLLGLLSQMGRRRLRRLGWMAMVGLSLILIRCAMYVLIEVWLKWGLHRYVEPNNLAVILVTTMLLFYCGALIRRGFTQMLKRSAALQN